MFQYKSTSTTHAAAKEEEFFAIAGIFEEVRNYMGFLAVQGQMKRSAEQRMIQQKEMEMTLSGQVGDVEQLQQQLEVAIDGLAEVSFFFNGFQANMRCSKRNFIFI